MDALTAFFMVIVIIAILDALSWLKAWVEHRQLTQLSRRLDRLERTNG